VPRSQPDDSPDALEGDPLQRFVLIAVAWATRCSALSSSPFGEVAWATRCSAFLITVKSLALSSSPFGDGTVHREPRIFLTW
jgi:hypothetical protein